VLQCAHGLDVSEKSEQGVEIMNSGVVSDQYIHPPTSPSGCSSHATHTPTLIDDWPMMYRNTLLMLMGGLSDKEIGDAVGVSKRTIHLRLNEWIYPALNVGGQGARLQAFLVALKGGVVPVLQTEFYKGAKEIHLTDSEREVLTFLGLGISREDIAGIRYGAVRGVDNHISHIHQKFGIYNQIQVMHIAHMLGLTSWESGKPEQVV